MSPVGFITACTLVERIRNKSLSIADAEVTARAPFGEPYLRALQLAADDADMDMRIRWAAQEALTRIATREAA